MPTITINEAYTRADRTVQARGMQKAASTILLEDAREQTTTKQYDIFLSHAFSDARAILGIKGLLEDVGHGVYIDWIEDPQLDRSHVTSETASILRSRMNICRSLFYVTTQAASESRWMPWECGYFDGKRGKTAILPVTQVASSQFQGQEYLGLYPYILKAPRQSDKRERLWVHRESSVYVEFEQWLSGKEPTRRQ